MPETILPTRNTDWGFFGTIRRHADADAAWPLATDAVARATGCEPEAVRAFLDSRHGRHFADDVVNTLHTGAAPKDAIDTAVARWMGWRIGCPVERLHGIPRDLPYLTGFVAHCGIAAEMAD